MGVMLGLQKTLKKLTIGLVMGPSLPNLPRYRVNPAEHVKLKRQVDLKLSNVKLIDNIFVNTTIDESHHDEIAYGLGPRHPTDLIPIIDHYKVFEPASPLPSPLASHVHELHKEINDKIA